MPVYAELTDDGLKAIEFRTNVAVEQVMAETVAQFEQFLKEEIPWESIRNEIKVSYEIKTKGQTTTRITVGEESSEFIWELWKGNPTDRIHTASGKAMKFSDWKNGPDELRSKDGFFYFKTVNHPPIEGNDFVGRAIARLRMVVKAQFGQKFANYFKNIRR